MKKALVSLLLCLPTMVMAQNTLTPEQQLEQAQRQLEQAKAALEQAKANAEKAKAEAEAKAKAADLQKKIEETKAETEKLQREAARIAEDTNKSKNTKTAPSTAPTPSTDNSNAAWVVPETPTTIAAKANKTVSNDNKQYYIKNGAVPEINGQVLWTEDVSVPGVSATELYDRALAFLTELTKGKNQIEGSKVALVNKAENSIVATMRERLIFSSGFLSLDFTQFNYLLQATCYEGHATLTMSRLNYNYDVQGNITPYTAENWITDKYALNKKHTRLLPVSGKFRRATIDRKDSIFSGFAQAMKQAN